MLRRLYRDIKCLSKQATVDDDPTGIRWIDNDLIEEYNQRPFGLFRVTSFQ